MVTQAFQLLLVACLTGGTLSAVDDPFVGTWKLDASKSTYTDRMKVHAAGANKYGLIFSGTKAETIVADGTDQPGLNGTTVSITIDAPDAWKVVRKKEGHLILMAAWKLSENGKTLRDHYIEYGPDGSTAFSADYVYTRAAGNSGFSGTWESAIPVSSVFEFQIQPWEGDGLSLVTSADHKTRNMKFDGRDYPDVGPDVAAGSASSGRRVNGQTLQITDKIKGKVMSRRQIKLSTDHKRLTMTVYPTGQIKPNTFVFDRE